MGQPAVTSTLTKESEELDQKEWLKDINIPVDSPIWDNLWNRHPLIPL